MTEKAEKTVEQLFVSAWCEIENPELDGVNPRFRNRYATLESTVKVIRKACKAQGIAYRQSLGREEGGYVLRSIVTDGSDAMSLSAFPVEAPPNPQSFGSNLTYAKRQQAQADWLITGEADDDGNAAADAVEEPREAQDAAPAEPVCPRKPPAGKEPPAEKKPAAKPPNPTPKKALWQEAGRLKDRAMSMGVKESGITSWMEANILGPDGGPLGMTDYADPDIKRLTEYLKGRIADMERLEEERRKPEADAGPVALAGEDIPF